MTTFRGYILLFLTSASAAFGSYWEGQLAEKVAINNTQYFVLEDGTVWQLCLNPERERTWDEWFSGIDAPLSTPNTVYHPQTWALKTPLRIDQIQNSGTYPYALYNKENQEYAIAKRIYVKELLDTLHADSWTKGYEKGKADGMHAVEAQVNDAYTSGYNAAQRAQRQEESKNVSARVQSVEDRTLILTNGISFEVSMFDRRDLESWMPGARVKVEKGKDTFYPVKITNLDSNEQINARKK